MRRVSNQLDCAVYLVEKSRLCRMTTLSVPGAAFFDFR
jgi:hypothetical protein